MKFTKEQAVEKLNQVLTNSGKKPLRMSERTLQGQTETLMSLVADDEMELDDFVDKIKASLEGINSNIEHDQSEFIKKYEKDHPTPPAPQPQDPPKPDDPNADLLRRIAELEQKNQAREERMAIEQKRNEIRQYLSDNNVKNTKWVDTVLGIASIGKDDIAEEKGKAYLELYNQSLQGGAPIAPGSPTPGGEITADAFNDVKAIRKRRAEVSK